MDEKKLELTLGLPGDSINWSVKKSSVREREVSLLSLGYFNNNNNNNNSSGVIGCGKDHSNHPWVSSSPSSCSPSSCSQKIQITTSNTENQKGLTVMGKDSSQPCCTIIPNLQSTETKKTAVTNNSQKRAAPAPVVGWPPIRSFRKNLASTSTGKPGPEPPSVIPSKPVHESPANIKSNGGNKGQFVKINMDGVPIGRKVDLSAYNNYNSLSCAVDELFRGLLAAQRDSSACEKDKQEEQKPITGLLDGIGEYTLVYEDNEGDRMLVGDVPWHMFVSTVKRLRVLKSSDLPTLNRCGNKEGKIVEDCSSK